MAIREGRWDCPSCGKIGNRGPEGECPACGAPRGEDVTFYLPDDAPEVTDPAALERARAGPDWTCPYCDGDNPATADLCVNCNAPRGGDATERPVREIRHTDPPPPTEPPPAEPVFAGTPPPGHRPGESQAGGAGKKSGGRPTVLGCLGGCGCLGLLLLALLAVLPLGRSEPVTATVTSVSWERAVEIRERTLVQEEAWQGSVPAGARVLDRWQVTEEGGTRTVTERVQTGTERVKVGVRDLGNGSFEDVYEERPVYETVRRTETEPDRRRTRVRYEREEWVTTRTERATGDRGPPTWPRLRLDDGESAGERTEHYRVRLRTPDGRTLLHTPSSEAEWQRFAVGQSWRVEARGDRVREVLGPG